MINQQNKWGANRPQVATCSLGCLQPLPVLSFLFFLSLFLFFLFLFLLKLGHRIHLPWTGGQQVEVNQNANS
ncbi:MAG: hypothetical protein OEY99_00485 [Aigarchaeota archaeon]|nr:hypothetical protein [Aigarchaeota archaeon]